MSDCIDCIVWIDSICILTVRIPFSVILEVCKVILYIDVFIPHRVPIGSIRDKGADPPCVDDARWTDCHAIRTYEIQVAVNFTVPDGVHRTLNINMTIHQIHQMIGVSSLVLLIEMHVGYMAGADFILVKFVQADVVIVLHRLHIDIVHIFASCQVIPTFFCNDTGKTAHRLQQNTGQHQRRDPPGGRAGTGNRLPAHSESLPFRRITEGYGLHPCSQPADDALCIIFAVIFCDFGDHHVTLPGMAPDDLVDLVHKTPQCASECRRHDKNEPGTVNCIICR